MSCSAPGVFARPFMSATITRSTSSRFQPLFASREAHQGDHRPRQLGRVAGRVAQGGDVAELERHVPEEGAVHRIPLLAPGDAAPARQLELARDGRDVGERGEVAVPEPDDVPKPLPLGRLVDGLVIAEAGEFEASRADAAGKAMARKTSQKAG